MSELIKTENSPDNLISQAISQGLGIEHLEKLMDLQDRWNEQVSKKSFYEAMSKFQEEKPDLIKDTSVSHDQGKTVKYKFAKLDQIRKKVDPILSKNGLSYKFKNEFIDSIIRVTCVVRHRDGYSEETTIESIKDTSGNKAAVQATGSTLSYLQRYTLCGALGLSSDEDTDANSRDAVGVDKDLYVNAILNLIATIGDKLDEKTLKRANDVIGNQEEASYKKLYGYLKSLKND